MFSPLPFPDWVPPWVHILALVVLAGVLLLFVLMPFSVFGLKSRLELIEARLDDIQAELRMIGQGQQQGQGQGRQQEYGQDLQAELADDTGRVETLRLQLDHAGFKLGIVQHVVDHRQQGLAGGGDARDIALLGFGQGLAGLQQMVRELRRARRLVTVLIFGV